MSHLHPNFHNGRFITVEGVNGCGKSSQGTRLSNLLRALGKMVLHTKEPTTEFVGRHIRQALQDKALLATLGPIGLQSWYALDSHQHMQEQIVPALKRGEIVISDRYRPSLVHSALRKEDIASLLDLNATILGSDFLKPDLTFIFDVTPEEAMKRLHKKGVKLDEQETLPEIARTRELYLELAKEWPGAIVIDAMRDEKEVFVQVRSEVAALLKILI
ncbi:MAG: dTMP kinase [bacterium]|nr:dTMP kinase [bacterium]